MKVKKETKHINPYWNESGACLPFLPAVENVRFMNYPQASGEVFFFSLQKKRMKIDGQKCFALFLFFGSIPSLQFIQTIMNNLATCMMHLLSNNCARESAIRDPLSSPGHWSCLLSLVAVAWKMNFVDQSHNLGASLVNVSSFTVRATCVLIH